MAHGWALESPCSTGPCHERRNLLAAAHAGVCQIEPDEGPGPKLSLPGTNRG
jgi:hypothetical protein